jgi:two-component system response regulator HydG
MTQAMCKEVLIITAEAETARVVLESLAERTLRGETARDAQAGLQMIGQRKWDLVLLDLDLLGEDSFHLIRQIKDVVPETPLVAFSRQAMVPLAVRAVREGCENFLVKPLSRQAVGDLLDITLPNHAGPEVQAVPDKPSDFCRLTGSSPKLLHVVRLARRVAPTSAPVLVTGESGIGKELLAHFIHRHSNRRNGPYVRVNCASLSESLLESELFGHERGAFTGAHAQRKGRFERANGGTLLLDEISETSNRLQAELLRVLETQEIERLGGHEPVVLNVRIICTSNRELVQEAKEGRFRADLFFRISAVHLRMPPLRDRREDLPELVWYFVNEFAPEVGRRITSLDQAMMDRLHRYHWPGNIRELRNVIRTALILGDGPTLALDPSQILCGPLGPMQAADNPVLSLQEVERQAILEALRRTSRNQVKAATLLGITDRTLREKLRKYRQDGLVEAVPEMMGD